MRSPPMPSVIDTETTIDATQRALFGSYRFLCLNDPDYPPEEAAAKRVYLRRRSAEARSRGVRDP